MTALLLCHWEYANNLSPKQTNNKMADASNFKKGFINIPSRSILTRRFVFPEENIIGNRIRWFSSNRNSDFDFISPNRLEDGNGLRLESLLLLTSTPYRTEYLYLVLSFNLFWWVKLKFYLWNCNLKIFVPPFIFSFYIGAALTVVMGRNKNKWHFYTKFFWTQIVLEVFFALFAMGILFQPDISYI